MTRRCPTTVVSLRKSCCGDEWPAQADHILLKKFLTQVGTEHSTIFRSRESRDGCGISFEAKDFYAASKMISIADAKWRKKNGGGLAQVQYALRHLL